MDTPNPTAQAAAAPMLPPKPRPAAAADLPPWFVGKADLRRSRRSRQLHNAELAHWVVAALTVVTAISIVVGAYSGPVSTSKELLPVVVTTVMR